MDVRSFSVIKENRLVVFGLVIEMSHFINVVIFKPSFVGGAVHEFFIIITKSSHLFSKAQGCKFGDLAVF